MSKIRRRGLVASVSYEVTDPTVDSQVIQLKSAGADVVFIETAPKAAAQAIRKIADLNWTRVRYLANASASVAAVLKPAGLDISKGIITAQYLKDATAPQWANDADFKEWKAWMAKYIRIGNLADSGCVYAYTVSSTLHDCLKRCGDDLARFSGETWELFGGVPSNESTWAALPAEFRSVTLAPGSTGDALPVEQTFASDKTRQGTALAQIPDPGCSFSQDA